MTQTQNRPAGNPAKRIGRRLLTGLGILLACNALFLAFMTLAFAAASQERVRGHVEMSLSTFRNDLESSPLIDETKAYMPDWRYDMIWVDIAANEPDGALRSAMLLPYLQSEEEQAWENANEGSFYTLLVPLLYYPDEEDVTEYTYSRYWMALTGILRFLFVFLELKEIRYLFWMAAILLFVYVTARMAQTLGMKYAVALALAFLSRSLLLHVFSLTTAIDVLVTLAGLTALLAFHDRSAFRENRLYYYLVLGILCFSVGSIIAPLLTLGIPLITELALEGRRAAAAHAAAAAPDSAQPQPAGEDRAAEESKAVETLQPAARILWILTASVSWLIGFAGSMVIKTVLATALFGNGGDTSGRFLEYLQPGTALTERFYIIGYCLEGVFAPNGVKKYVLAAAALLFLLLIALRGFRKRNMALFMLFVGLYPIVWSLILVGHSSHFFVANIYAVVVYALFAALCELSGDGRATASAPERPENTPAPGRQETLQAPEGREDPPPPSTRENA